MSVDLIKKYKKNPNLTKEWVKELLKKTNGSLEKINEIVIEIKNRMDDRDELKHYVDLVIEFDEHYSQSQEGLVSFHALFLEG